MNGQIIPAILSNNYEGIEMETAKAKKVQSRVQIDFCDGVFVPSKTWPFTKMNNDQFINLGEKLDNDFFLPNWEDLEFTADLMLENPLDYINTLAQYGFDDLVIHFRTLTEDKSEREKYFKKILEKAESFDMSVNLAVDLNTDLQDFIAFVNTFKSNINYIQVMGIKNIGKQGEEFDAEVLGVIKTLKEKFDLPIFVDGGINAKSIKMCIQAGVDVFVVGSALSKAIDYKTEFNYLNNL